MAPPTVGIIGGGVSGLMCATRLHELGLAPTVFDTGKRHVGGRASSRRMGFQGVDGKQVSLTVDHAAQFFLCQRAPFCQYVKRWAEAGVVARWTEPVGVLRPGAGFRAFPTPENSSPLCRWVAAGDGGMGELWAGVARELGDVRTNIWVSNLERTQSGSWRVLDGRGSLLAEVDYVVVAHNGKCADRLMAKAGVPRIHRLLQCKFAPKVTSPTKMHLSSLWMCVAVFEKTLGLSWAGAEIEQHPVLSWAGNNSKKPGYHHEGNYEAWTLLSTRQFGAANKVPQEDIPPAKRAQVTDQMIQAFYQAAGLITADGRGPQPVHTFVQLWGAAVPLNVLGGGAPSVLDADSAVGVCGDWFTSPCIEGAAESGIHLADSIAAHARPKQPNSATATAPADDSEVTVPAQVFSAFTSHSIGDVPLDDAALKRSMANARAAATTVASNAPPRRERSANKPAGHAGSTGQGRVHRPHSGTSSTSSQPLKRSAGKPISGGFTGGAADSSLLSAQSAVGSPSSGSARGGRGRRTRNRGPGKPINGGSTAAAAEPSDQQTSRGRGGRGGRGGAGRGRGRGRANTLHGGPGKQSAPARLVSAEP